MVSDGQIAKRNHQSRVGARLSKDRKKSRVNEGGRPRLKAGEKSILVSTSVPESIYRLIPAEKPEWLRQVIIENLMGKKLKKAPKSKKRSLENLSGELNRELLEKAKIKAMFAEIIKLAKAQAINEETKALQEKQWKLLLQ